MTTPDSIDRYRHHPGDPVEQHSDYLPLTILIAGVPNAGKTTLSRQLSDELSLPVRHADDLAASHEWSEASAEVARWIGEGGSWIIEGVSVVRALRKWLAQHNALPPVDQVIWIPTPRVELSRGQDAMAKGVHTVWNEVLPELTGRGQYIEVR